MPRKPIMEQAEYLEMLLLVLLLENTKGAATIEELMRETGRKHNSIVQRISKTTGPEHRLFTKEQKLIDGKRTPGGTVNITIDWNGIVGEYLYSRDIDKKQITGKLKEHLPAAKEFLKPLLQNYFQALAAGMPRLGLLDAFDVFKQVLVQCDELQNIAGKQLLDKKLKGDTYEFLKAHAWISLSMRLIGSEMNETINHSYLVAEWAAYAVFFPGFNPGVHDRRSFYAKL